MARILLVGVDVFLRSKLEALLPEHKLLAVPVREPRFAEYTDISDVPQHVLAEIEHFFDVFKELEGKDLQTRGWEGAEQAQAVLTAALKAGAARGG